jgi:hypothetical protein
MIYAVIWQDMGLLLSLPKPTPEEAIVSAKAMQAKSATSGITLHHLRAVSLDQSDTLRTLWEAAL